MTERREKIERSRSRIIERRNKRGIGVMGLGLLVIIIGGSIIASGFWGIWGGLSLWMMFIIGPIIFWFGWRQFAKYSNMLDQLEFEELVTEEPTTPRTPTIENRSKSKGDWTLEESRKPSQVSSDDPKANEEGVDVTVWRQKGQVEPRSDVELWKQKEAGRFASIYKAKMRKANSLASTYSMSKFGSRDMERIFGRSLIETLTTAS